MSSSNTKGSVPYEDLNKQFINGVWKDGSDKLIMENINPYNNEVIFSMPSASPKDVDEAYEAAKKAFTTWGASNPHLRRDIMLKAASILMARFDEFVNWLTIEAGSTFLKAAFEITLTYDMLVEASSFPGRMTGLTVASSTEGKEAYAFRKPLGVVALISPWNFPLYLSMRTIAPALAVGNTILLKPSPASIVTSGTIMARLFEEAGLPAGVFNVVTGDNNVVGDYITSHPVPKMISFTGSTAVGKHIGKIAGEGLKKVALELGGSAPFVVLDDANVDNAVDSAIFGKFVHQGQICMSTNRIIVHENLIKEFTQKFVEKAKKLVAGDPLDKSTIIGPLIDRKAVDKVLKVVADSVAMGAKVESGNTAEGNVLHPTILSGITIEMPIFNKEIFGPAVGIISFKTDDEAIALANDTEYGLSGAVHGGDIFRAMEVARRINTGMIHVNDQSVNDEPHLPFGGEKSSGLGRFGGHFILEEMTTVQLVTIQKTKRIYPF